MRREKKRKEGGMEKEKGRKQNPGHVLKLWIKWHAKFSPVGWSKDSKEQGLSTI